MSGAQQLQVTVVLAPSNDSELQSLLRGLYDPNSPQYHHWLQPGQYLEEFGPSASETAAVVSWLNDKGLTTSVSGFAVHATAPASRMSAALGVSFDRYRTHEGRIGYLADKAPLVPAALASGEIRGILGLDTLEQPTPEPLSQHPQKISSVSNGSSTPAADEPGPCAAATAEAAPGYYTMDQLGAAYGINSLLDNGQDGHGQTVALYELAPHLASDTAAYNSCLGLHDPVSTVNVDGGGTADSGGTAEADLDIEQAATQAPGASIVSYEGPNTPTGGYDTWAAIVDTDTAKVVSSSWGMCEPDAVATGEIPSLSTLFQQAATQGQTILVASGDSGSEGCFEDGVTGTYVQYPASDPSVTAVGGTSLLAPGDEPPWNFCQGDETPACADTFGGYAASGGGMSLYESRQASQPELYHWTSTEPCGSYCREVPDVSANAGVGMVAYVSGAWSVYGGTSLAAPFMAGLVADRNDGCTAASGLFTPALYGLASQGAYGTAFNDITGGDNDMTGDNDGLFPALPGYDAATGVGSPIAGGLSCPEVTSVSPATGVAGSTVRLTGLGLEKARISFGGATAEVVSANATAATVQVPPVSGSITVSGTSALGTGIGSVAFTVAAGIGPRFTVDTPPASATAGQAYAYTFHASGTPTPTYRLIAAPSFLAINSSTGAVSGRPPTGAATFGYSVVASNGAGAVTVGPFKVAVATARPPACASATGTHLGSAVGIASVSIGGCRGYYVTDSAGRVSAFGAAVWQGDLSTRSLNAPIISIAATADGKGYWLVGANGSVFTYGDAHFYGSTASVTLNAPVVGMAVTQDNKGYWMVARDGGVFTFGDARFYGSTGDLHLNQPVDGIAVAPGGHGYWLVASDGGVFTFTADGFFGSLGTTKLNKPIVGMSSTADGRGYTLVGSDGGVFSFGDAPFYGSLGKHPPASPIVDLSPTPANNGYYLVGSTGAVYAFGPGAKNLGQA